MLFFAPFKTMMEAIDLLEYVAVGLNILYVVFAARKKLICWLFGGIASVLSVALFIAKGLYAESFLYGFYALMAVWGFLAWKRSGEQGPIESYGYPAHIGFFIIATFLAFVIYRIFGLLPGAEMAALDATTTGFSLLATWLTIRREMHNWAYWVIINAVSTWLYWSRDLPIYALFMAVMGVLAIYGYMKWRRDYFQQAYA